MTSELLRPTTLFTPLSVLAFRGGRTRKGRGHSITRRRVCIWAREGAGGADGTFEQSLGGETMRVFLKV